jgi:hypothetical protein
VRRWRSQIRIGGRKLHLGYFDTEREAHEAYLDAYGQSGEWQAT